MTPQRWRQIEVLYNAARDRGSEALADADPSLRRQVEELLAQAVAGKIPDRLAPELLTTQTQIAAGAQLGPYRIEAPIGKGGMGQVFRATDMRLGRAVAIKVCEEKFTNRFEREARAIAALNHPNICTLFDIGPNYLVMELVEGETLAERLSRGALPVDEALRAGMQIAEALESAHAKGITHRDLKPANLKMTPAGRVKVLDFGLAKSALPDPSGSDADDLSTVTAVTRPGVILGTPAYMSPEQMRGETVDHRADIWAFGCVLYELLTGRRPFHGAHFTDIIASVLRTDPDWNALPAVTPAAAREALRGCLNKDAQGRCADIRTVRRELEAALRQTSTEVSSSAGPSTSGAPAPRNRERQVAATELSGGIHSIAVLPLVNTSGDEQMEYLSDGLTESIIFSLSQLPRLRVMARSTVFRHKGSAQSAHETGRALGVQSVLAGTVLQRGETLLIRVELVEVATGWQLWSAQYKAKSADLITTEEEISQQISNALRLKLTPEKQQLLAKRQADNVEAYHLLLKGRFYWGKRTEEGLNKALQYFREAIELDPLYAQAHAGLSECYVPLAVYCHLAPTDAWPKARAAARRALEIDPDLAEARTVLGSCKSSFDWDLDAAEQEVRAALVLNPNYPRARQVLAEIFTMKGRFAEANAEVRRALDLDPLSLHMNAAVVMDHYFSREPQDAIKHGVSAIDLDPTFYPTHFYLGLAYQHAGQFEKAVAELEYARTLSKDSTLVSTSLAGALAGWGKTEQARHILGELEQPSSQKYVPQSFVAAVHAGLGDQDEALTRLERAYDERCGWLLRCALLDARLDVLRDAPRFQTLLKRMQRGTHEFGHASL
jgi:serine/threonine-protein kinase